MAITAVGGGTSLPFIATWVAGDIIVLVQWAYNNDSATPTLGNVLTLTPDSRPAIVADVDYHESFVVPGGTVTNYGSARAYVLQIAAADATAMNAVGYALSLGAGAGNTNVRVKSERYFVIRGATDPPAFVGFAGTCDDADQEPFNPFDQFATLDVAGDVAIWVGGAGYSPGLGRTVVFDGGLTALSTAADTFNQTRGAYSVPGDIVEHTLTTASAGPGSWNGDSVVLAFSFSAVEPPPPITEPANRSLALRSRRVRAQELPYEVSTRMVGSVVGSQRVR